MKTPNCTLLTPLQKCSFSPRDHSSRDVFPLLFNPNSTHLLAAAILTHTRVNFLLYFLLPPISLISHSSSFGKPETGIIPISTSSIIFSIVINYCIHDSNIILIVLSFFFTKLSIINMIVMVTNQNAFFCLLPPIPLISHSSSLEKPETIFVVLTLFFRNSIINIIIRVTNQNAWRGA